MRMYFIIALLFSPPAWAAGNYGFTPDAGKMLNEAKQLIQKEKYKRAIGKLEKAMRDEPDNADIYNYLASPTESRATMKPAVRIIKRLYF